MGLTFTFNNVSSETMPVIVTRLPVVSSPEQRADTFSIPGRDGTFTTVQDDHSSYTASAEILLTDYARRAEVVAWLRGSGDLILAELSGYAMKARITKGIAGEWFSTGIKKAIVEFEIQPFLYEATPAVIELTGSGNITNSGTRFALPIITVTGTGTFSIGGDSYSVTETGVVINSEIEECYIGTDPKNDKVTGGFPVIQPGVVAVVLGSGITKLTIQGNWRWY